MIKKRGKKNIKLLLKSKKVTIIQLKTRFLSRKKQTILFLCDFRIKVNAFLKKRYKK